MLKILGVASFATFLAFGVSGAQAQPKKLKHPCLANVQTNLKTGITPFVNPSHKACVKRGVSRGTPEAQASAWCTSNGYCAP